MKLKPEQAIEDYKAYLKALDASERRRRNVYYETLPTFDAYCHMNGIELIKRKRNRTITVRKLRHDWVRTQITRNVVQYRILPPEPKAR